MTTDPRVQFLRETNLEFNKEFNQQLKIAFERRFGMRYNKWNFDSLSRTEQDWVITEAGRRVQKIRQGVLPKWDGI